MNEDTTPHITHDVWEEETPLDEDFMTKVRKLTPPAEYTITDRYTEPPEPPPWSSSASPEHDHECHDPLAASSGSHFNPIFPSDVYPVSDNEFGLGYMIMQAIYAILAPCGVGGAMWLSIVEDQNLISWLREQHRRSKPKHMSSMDDYIRHTQLDGR